MSLDVSSLMTSLSAKASDLQGRLNDGSFDPSDEGQLLKMQVEISQYQQLAGITSAIVSDVKQTAQGIIQKI